MRLLWLAGFLASPILACGCIGTTSACSGMGGSAVVFVGRVLIDSGEGWGKGPAHVLIEESLLNVPKDLREVDIDTTAGTSCYYRLKAGERYVIYAAPGQGRLSINACSTTFLLRDNEHVLDALRNMAEGGDSRLVGKVLRSSGTYSRDGAVAGAIVVARSGETSYQTRSDAVGKYEIRGLPPGRYQIEVSKDGFSPDAEFNRRWSGKMVADESTRTIRPDKSEPGTVLITERSCEVWNLSLWPRGHISGRITNSQGAPLAGVTVQAFAFDGKGERESCPLRTGRTDAEGKYTIEPLPGGDYVVGVNAARYLDDDPHPQTVFSGGKDWPAKVHVADGEATNGIDFAVAPQRTAAKLHVRIMGPGGTTYANAMVRLENPGGLERWHSKTDEPLSGGGMEVPVYVGERYVVKVHVSVSGANRKFDYLEGSAPVDVADAHPAVVVILSPRRYRD